MMPRPPDAREVLRAILREKPAGAAVFGKGPSLDVWIEREMRPSFLRDHATVAVNEAGACVPWIDMVVWMDTPVWRRMHGRWPRMAWIAAPSERHRYGYETPQPCVFDRKGSMPLNASSAVALWLLGEAGAQRVEMIGFDGRDSSDASYSKNVRQHTDKESAVRHLARVNESIDAVLALNPEMQVHWYHRRLQTWTPSP